MIRQIRGQLLEIDVTHVVVDVSGVGYLIHTNTAALTTQLGTEVTFYTHLAVRENALDLYGFASKEELSVFGLLLDLPKIGPKSALQILSQTDIALLRQAVATQDATYLTKMSGIGKKSAEKIVLGLKDKLAADESGLATTGMSTHASSSDTIDALVTLGYSEQQAREVVQQLQKEQPETTDTKALLREALKLLHTS